MSKRRARSAGEMYDPNVLLRKPTLRIEEAAFLLHVTPRSVSRYLDDGKLACTRTPGGIRRVSTASIKPYL